MKILVTGANGFLGISLLHSLKENRAEGHIIDMPPPLAGIHHNKSLADAIGLGNFLTTIERDCIVHPAGVAINPDIQTYYAVNTGLAANLIWGLMEWGNLNCPVSYRFIGGIRTYI